MSSLQALREINNVAIDRVEIEQEYVEESQVDDKQRKRNCCGIFKLQTAMGIFVYIDFLMLCLFFVTSNSSLQRNLKKNDISTDSSNSTQSSGVSKKQ